MGRGGRLVRLGRAQSHQTVPSGLGEDVLAARLGVPHPPLEASSRAIATPDTVTFPEDPT
jgi:hypothetical protein